MKILLPLLLFYLLIGYQIQEAIAQPCPALTVSLPADKNYCGQQLVSFASSNPNHAPTYPANTSTINSYTWQVNGTVIATSQYPSINFPKADVYTVVLTITNTCGESATDTQIINIENIPFAPAVDDVAACTGSSATLWVNNPDPNIRYRWYDSNNNLLVWGTSYTKINASSNATYQIEAISPSDCVSPRTTARLTVSSTVGNADIISSDQEICAGSQPQALNGNAPQSMTFQWFQSTTGPNTDFYPISNDLGRKQSYQPTALAQTTWFKRVAYNNGCGEESNVVKITVTPLPATPQVSAAFICSGTQATLRVTNPDQAAVYKWYEVASGGTSIGSGPVFTTREHLTANKIYYVEASNPTNTNCSNNTITRTQVQVNVTSAITNNAITANQSTCSGGTPATLEGSIPQGGGGGYIYQWQHSVNGTLFTDISGANAKDFAPGALTATTWYRRKVRTASECPETISNTVQIAVAPLPASINIAEPSVCLGSSTTINITNPDENYTYRWYDVATGGSILATGASFKTSPLTSNQIYYVDATTAAGCITNRRSVEVKVTPVPAVPVVNDATVCSGASATLTVNSTDASFFYRWYTNDGTLLATGTSYQTGPLTVSTTYYAEAVTKASPGCTSTRKAVAVTIIPVITNNIIPGNQQICSGVTPAAFTGSLPEGGGGGYMYQWVSSEDNILFTSIPEATGRNYAPKALTTTTWFRRIVTAASSCSPVTSNTLKVEVNSLPAAPIVPNVIICTGTTATVKVSAPDANLIYNWYTTAAGGVPFATDVNTVSTEVLTSDKTYYVETITAVGCKSISRTAVTVTVSSLPPVPVVDDAAVCAGNTALLSIVAPVAGLRYQWFDAATGGTLLASGTSFTTPVLPTNATYYVQAVNSNDCASPSRKAVTIAVINLPEIPEVAGATICSGSNTTLYITNPDPALLYRWYKGNTLLTTNTSLPTGNLTSSTTYEVEAVTNNSSACTSAGRRTVVVNVILPITNNTISASQTICSSSTPAPLTGTMAIGGSSPLTYQWEKSENGTAYTFIAGATNPSYTPGPLATTTWYRRRVKGSDSCPENVSSAVQITVNALPANPVADGKTICMGTATTLSVNAPETGITYKWYNAAVGGSIVSNDPTLLTDNLSGNTTYYVEATNTAGCTSARKPVAVTVRNLPEMPMAANQQICQGQNTMLSVTSPNPALTYKWYNANGNLLSSLPSLNVTNLPASATYFLEANYTSNPVCASPRREVIVTVTPLPDLPVVNDITICTGTKGILKVQEANPAFIYNWYIVSSGGTAIATDPTFETPGTLSSARTYYVEASTTTGCSSGRRAVTIQVTPLPETPFASNIEICAGKSAVLTVSDATGTLTYNWYASNTAVTPLGTGVTYPTGALSASTTFYLEAITAAGCVSSSRHAVQVLVTELPAVPNAENKIICAGGSAILSVNNPEPSVIYKWYNDEGTQVGTGNFYNTGSLSESKNYYLEAVTKNSTSCASVSRRTVTVTIIPAIANNIISANQTICNGTAPAALLGAVPYGGGTDYAYQWEQSYDGTNFTTITNATNQHYTPGVLTTNVWFRRKVTATGPCVPSLSNPVQIITIPAPSAPVAANATVCAGSTAVLTIREADPNSTYYWYSTATGGTVLKIDNSFETPELSATTTYYVESVNANGCISPRRAVTANVISKPTIPITPDQFICAGQKATLTISASAPDLVYSWYDQTGTLVGSGTSYTTRDPLFASTTYYVEAVTITTPICVSGRRAVAVSVTTMPDPPIVENVTICAGTNATLSVRVIDPAITYQWYTAETGGTPVKAASSYTTTTLTSNRMYYVEAVTAAGCTSARTAVAVTVTPLPATPLAEDVTICAGSTASLTVTNSADNLVYHWYDAATDGNLLATGTEFTTRALSGNTTFYLEAATRTNCSSSARQPVTVHVTPLPVTPEVNNATVCAGNTITLWVTNQASGHIYKWYDNTGRYLATGTSYTTQELSASTTFSVEAVTNTGIACASTPRKTVAVTVTSPVSNNAIGADQAICTNSVPTTFTGSVPAGGNGNYAYQWERSHDGINFTVITGAISQDYTSTDVITSNAWFRRKVKAIGSSCPEHISNTVQVTEVALPAAPLANNPTICAGTTAPLQVSNPDNGLIYRWYETATGGNPLRSAPNFETDLLNQNTVFYVEAMNASGCTSARRAVTVTVTPLPETPIVTGKSICAGQTTTLVVASPVTGFQYKWYTANGVLLTTGTTYTTPALDATATYFVEATATGNPVCVSSSRRAVTVAVTALPQAPIVAGASVCSGQTAKLMVSVIDPNLTYKWYTVARGGTAVAASATFTTPNLTSGRIYYVEAVTTSGCAGPRTTVNVDVSPLPATPLADNLEVCAGTTATLSVTSPDNNLTYKWYDAATDGNLLATGDTYPVISINNEATFYVEAETATGCASPARKAVEVTIISLPLTPQVNNVTVCAGQTATLLVITPEAGAIYNWYNTNGLIFTGTTFTTPVLQANTVYYVEAVTNNRNACASSSRRTVTVTVTPAIANNNISTNQTICSGRAPEILIGTTVTGGEGSYTYQWERSINGINFSEVPGATEKSFLPGVQTSTVWYRRKVKAAGTCQPSESNSVQITIIPQPGAPVVPGVAVCKDAPATLQISNANNAFTYNWYSQVTGGNSLHTGQSFTVADLDASVTYYVEAMNGNGCTSARRAVTITVIAKPETPVAANQEICYGQTATLQVTAPASGLIYRWYNGDGALLRTGTSFSPEGLTANTTFYLEATTTTTPACVSDRSTVNVVVISLPASPVAENVIVCSGSSARLAVKEVDPTLTYKWYSVPTGGTAEAEAASFTTSPLTSNRDYYVEAVTASGCASGRVTVAVTVTPLPATPLADNISICSGATATLTVTTPINNLVYNWYDAATNGNLLAAGGTYTTRVLTASTTFYVAAVTPDGCASTTRRPVAVTVTPLPAVPEVDNATICQNNTVTLWVKNPEPGITYRWYENNLLQATGNSFTPDNVAASTIYQVEAVSSTGSISGTTCSSSSRKTVTVTVIPIISNNTIRNNQTICSNSAPARLTGSLPAGGGGDYAYEWQSSEDGVNFTSIVNANAQDYTPENLSISTWFRRKVKASTNCAEQISNLVKITVVALPGMPQIASVTICAGSNATLQISSPETGLSYRWFETASGGSNLATSTSFRINNLTRTTAYYVEAVNADGCASLRRAVTVTVTPLPTTPQVLDKTICIGERTTLTVTSPTSGLNYRWFDGNGTLLSNNSSYTTPVLATTTVFYVEAQTAATPNCSSQRKAVTVSVTQLPEMPEVDEVSICANRPAILTVKQADPTFTYKWYSVATGGVALSILPSYETAALTSNQTYFVEAITASGCASARTPVKVNVTPSPATPQADNKAICAGQNATLSVIAPDGNLTYRWYDTNGNIVATGTNYVVIAPQVSTTVYLQAETAAGCTSATRKAVVVRVTPLPEAPIVENAAVCAGSKVTLFVKNPDPALEYRWYTDAAATNWLGSGNSFTSADALFSGKSFFVEGVNAAGCTSAIRKQVDVAVTSKPNAPVVENATICAGSTATLAVVNGESNLVYKWFDANSTLLHTGTAYTTVPLSSRTNFYVTAFTGNNSACASTRQEVTVAITTTITNNTISNEQTICSGEAPARLTGSVPTGGSAATLVYQWEQSEDGVNFVSIVGANAQDYAPDNLTVTTWFRRKVKAAGPCAENISKAIRITAVPLPDTPQADNVTVCAGASASLMVKNPFSTINNITYRWYNTASGGTTLGSGISFRTPTLTARTTFYVEAAGRNGCSSSRRAVEVLVNHPITNNTINSDQVICTGSKPADFFGSIPDGGNGNGGFTYQWQRSTDNNFYTDIAGATGQNYIPTEAPAKTTWFRRKVKAAGPCEEYLSNAVKIEVVPAPLAPTVTNVAICPGTRATLEAAAMAGLTVEWYDAPSGGNLLFVGSAYQTSVLATTTSYWVQTVNSSNCASAERQEGKVKVVPPQVTASSDLTTTKDKPVQLIASGGASYIWSPNTGLSDSKVADPVARPAKTTTYTVTINTEEGCSVTKQVTITVLPTVQPGNVFTPNGDGFNDNFEIKNIENYPDSYVEIFTRWGEKVFESKGYNQPWDGTKNGKALPMSAYYYMIRLNKTDKPISGSVTLVK